MSLSVRAALLPLLLALSAAPAPAALAPHYQRLAELNAVLGHAGVVSAFEGIPIDRIEIVGPDRYRVTGGRCRLDVAIVGLPVPSGMAGARRFEVRPGRKVCGR